MDLKAAVEKYRDTVKTFGRPMALSEFGVSKSELQAALSSWEEDYALNRHFELIPFSSSLSVSHAEPAGHPDVVVVAGTAYTAIVFKESIQDVLA